MEQRKRHRLILPILAGVVALAVGFWAGTSHRALTPLESGTDLRGSPRPLPEFTLVDQHGQAFGKERLLGHWTLVFFGYTHCPDVCPTTLATMRHTLQRYEALGGDPKDWQVLFVSVDPERDPPEQLARYVAYFSPDFIGATGTPEQLKHLALSLGVVFGRVENPADPENYLVDHSASLIAIDPQGRQAAVFSPPHVPDALARDLLILARESEGA